MLRLGFTTAALRSAAFHAALHAMASGLGTVPERVEMRTLKRRKRRAPNPWGAIELFGNAAEIRMERVARGFVTQERATVCGVRRGTGQGV